MFNFNKPMMIKYLPILLLLASASLPSNDSHLRDHIVIKLHTYESPDGMRANALPELKSDSELMHYQRRISYLLMNVPEIHLPEKHEERNEIGKLYPDTTAIKELYLNHYTQDEKLVRHFEETIAPIVNPNLEITRTFTEDELMEVASKFFYCRQIEPDTSIQAYVCIGINGVKEANWEKDYTLLEAFCYEAIFSGFDDEDSQIRDTFHSEKEKSCDQFRQNITSLDQYLEYVKLELFERMRNSDNLKLELLEYYELNRRNLAFRVTN
jgi:hypothetical protein